MSNPTPEIVLDENEASRVNQQQFAGNTTTKKKSGFVITSVTDSGHGRPASIVRDGEESADDLDESHTSYSDVSYSRTTDADHDQESTASEDTLNISAHESSVAPVPDGQALGNHVGVHHSQQPQHVASQQPGEGNSTSKPNPQKDPQKDTKQSSQLAATATPAGPNPGHLNTLTKQPSENLESPTELPHDSVTSDNVKENKPSSNEKKADNSPPHTSANEPKATNGTVTPSGVEQSHDQTVTINTSTIPSTAGVHLATSNFTLDSEATAMTERPTVFTTGLMSSANPMPKNMPVTTPLGGMKAPGTRVYKVVKRDAHQPSKRVRGRWTYYDFSDNQSPMIGLVTQPVSDTRIAQDGTQLQQLAYSGQLIGPYGLPHADPTSSMFKEQLQAGLSANSSFGTSSINWEDMKQHYAQYDEDYKHRTLKPDGSLAPEAIRSAMKKYASRTPGGPAAGDLSAAAQTLKIDNKIEAAMDLVKKHLMSAVRDEVDELKEKIKDLTAENLRLKTESQEILAAIPPEIKSQLPIASKTDAQSSDNLPTSESKPSSSTLQASTATTENGGQQPTQPNTSEHSGQKGNANPPTSMNSHAPSSQADAKVKVASMNQAVSNSSAQQQRQEPPKAAASKTPTVAQPPITAQPHTSAGAQQVPHQSQTGNALQTQPQPATLQHNAEPAKSENAEGNGSKGQQQTAKTADISFNNTRNES